MSAGATVPPPRAAVPGERVPPGERVLRVDWVPGSDRLRGHCFCGAQAEAEEPSAMWEWLLAHPAHPAGGPDGPATAPVPPPPAHVVTDPAKILGRGPVGV